MSHQTASLPRKASNGKSEHVPGLPSSGTGADSWDDPGGAATLDDFAGGSAAPLPSWLSLCLPLPSSSLRLTSLLGTLVALDQSIARTKPKSASVLGVQGKAILALVGFTTGYALGFLW